MIRRPPFGWRALALVLALSLAGCFTPSVPIPPPSAEKIAFEVDPQAGAARFSYEPDGSYSMAIFYVYNRSRGVGVIEQARVDGSVGPSDPFAAEPGDQVVVSVELDAQIASICVELQDGPSSQALECVE